MKGIRGPACPGTGSQMANHRITRLAGVPKFAGCWRRGGCPSAWCWLCAERSNRFAAANIMPRLRRLSKRDRDEHFDEGHAGPRRALHGVVPAAGRYSSRALVRGASGRRRNDSSGIGAAIGPGHHQIQAQRAPGLARPHHGARVSKMVRRACQPLSTPPIQRGSKGPCRIVIVGRWGIGQHRVHLARPSRTARSLIRKPRSLRSRSRGYPREGLPRRCP